MTIQFSKLKEADFKQVKEIYDYYIENSVATFHTHPISIKQLKESIYLDHPVYQSFLIFMDNEVCGFCYLTQYKKRPAYDRTAEFTVYLKTEFMGRGIGSIALNKLEEIASEAGLKVLIGVVTATNEASVALCEKQGFEKCAHFKQVGEKFGKVLDVVAYQKIL